MLGKPIFATLSALRHFKTLWKCLYTLIRSMNIHRRKLHLFLKWHVSVFLKLKQLLLEELAEETCSLLIKTLNWKCCQPRWSIKDKLTAFWKWMILFLRWAESKDKDWLTTLNVCIWETTIRKSYLISGLQECPCRVTGSSSVLLKLEAMETIKF